MLEHLPLLEPAWHGLWERTLLERHGPGSLTNDRPAKVFWLQTSRWHADIRIPLGRPEFEGVNSLDDCSDQQLSFIAGQEAFCGITRVEGKTCTWLRLYDLSPGTALDVARMEFSGDDLIIETGIAENYLEHWSLVDDSRPDARDAIPKTLLNDAIFLESGTWGIQIIPRQSPPANIDLYEADQPRSRETLLWQASLCVSLCHFSEGEWIIQLSTLPWLEGMHVSEPQRLFACA